MYIWVYVYMHVCFYFFMYVFVEGVQVFACVWMVVSG